MIIIAGIDFHTPGIRLTLFEAKTKDIDDEMSIGKSASGMERRQLPIQCGKENN